MPKYHFGFRFHSGSISGCDNRQSIGTVGLCLDTWTHRSRTEVSNDIRLLNVLDDNIWKKVRLEHNLSKSFASGHFAHFNELINAPCRYIVQIYQSQDRAFKFPRFPTRLQCMDHKSLPWNVGTLVRLILWVSLRRLMDCVMATTQELQDFQFDCL